MTRQEPEGEGRVSRSYSLASAPLRLLSHSFHSTANTHSSGNNLTPSPATASLPLERPYSSDTLLKESSSLDHISLHHDVSHVHDVSDKFMSLEPSNTPVVFNNHQCEPLNPVSVPVPVPVPVPAPKLRHPEHLLSAQMHQSLEQHLSISDASVLKSGANSCEHDYSSYSEPMRKATKLFSKGGVDTSPRSISTLLQEPEIGSRLEKLLLPYDIRYSIFGRLSLQDIYHCQLTCKLLYWATSDQLIWKRIALNLIQGEFYFDIPRTLPTNIPNWKFFCKRHLLRQRNWRQGRVQDVISLDDNYQKLTTLQIMAPYVLTGCDDGRIHLWNINTRTLLHRFQIHGEITWVEHLQDQRIVAGLGYDLEKGVSEIRLFSTENGEQIGFYKEDFWDLAICAINGTYLVASNGEGRYSAWDWKAGTKVSQFQVAHEESITESLYLVQNTILELHYDGLIRLFSIHGECYGRLTLDNILPNHQVSFCWLHNDYSLVVWESSNTMAHIRLPLLMQNNGNSSNSNNINRLARPISQEEWDTQGAEIYWRHQLQHTCNFAAMGGGRFQLLYVEIFENLMDQVPIRVHSLRPSRPTDSVSAINTDEQSDVALASGSTLEDDAEGYGWQHGEYVTAHSLNPELEKIIQGLRPSRVDCDPEYIVVGLVQGGVRLLQFAPVDEDLFEKT